MSIDFICIFDHTVIPTFNRLQRKTELRCSSSVCYQLLSIIIISIGSMILSRFFFLNVFIFKGILIWFACFTTTCSQLTAFSSSFLQLMIFNDLIVHLQSTIWCMRESTQRRQYIQHTFMVQTKLQTIYFGIKRAKSPSMKKIVQLSNGTQNQLHSGKPVAQCYFLGI